MSHTPSLDELIRTEMPYHNDNKLLSKENQHQKVICEKAMWHYNAVIIPSPLVYAMLWTFQGPYIAFKHSFILRFHFSFGLLSALIPGARETKDVAARFVDVPV